MIKNVNGFSTILDVAGGATANETYAVVASGRVVISSLYIACAPKDDFNAYWRFTEFTELPRVTIMDSSDTDKFSVLANHVSVGASNFSNVHPSFHRFINLPGFGFKLDNGLSLKLQGKGPDTSGGAAFQISCAVTFQS
tara:strand:+ start:3408 stop:3824 length:417 start_codon:yes stop_codon:yes gene_type:complete